MTYYTNRPFFVKFLCLFTFLTSGQVILRTMHLLPERQSTIQAYAGHPVLIQQMAVIQAVLALVAAFFLWGMSKLAAQLYLISFFTSIVLAIYLLFISPSSSATQSRLHPATLIVALCIGFIFEGGRCWYAWWVTNVRPL